LRHLLLRRSLAPKGFVMGAFATAYAIVWFAVVLYLVRLERRQRSLLQTIESLRARLPESERDVSESPVSKAA
jgi:CcmD family protein